MNSDIDIKTYSYSFSDSYNTNKILSNTITEIEIEKQNRTELIQNMINNLFEQIQVVEIINNQLYLTQILTFYGILSI